jgi:hypothetical protein
MTGQRPHVPVLGIGACVAVALVGIQWARGAFDEPQPCIQVPAMAHQTPDGYWWAGTIGPYGWSRPGSDDCVVEVP